MEKLKIFYNKTLKLTNACIYHVQESDLTDMDRVIFRMENYIRSKGSIPIGPVIQFAQVDVNEAGEPEVQMQIIRQTNSYIVNTEQPYTTQPQLRIPNCLFCRFCGEEDQLHFAYDKLNLISFEEDIPLTGKTYTVFTGQTDDGLLTADIFAEKKES